MRYAPLLLIAVAGCSNFGTTTVPTIDAAKGVYQAKAAYAVALTAATAYARLVRCGSPTSPPLCSDPNVVLQMKKADLAADATTQSAENAVRSLGSNPSVVQAAVTASTQAVAAFKAITDAYAAGK